MRPRSVSTPRRRAFLARPLIALTLTLQGLHLVVLLTLPHAGMASNLLQFALPLLATAVSLQQRFYATNHIGRACWSSLAAAFAIWTAAQGIFLYLLSFPPKTHFSLRPDDALWLLFGLPLLLAINITSEEADRIIWLDRAQAIIFFAVLYLLVLLPPGRITSNNAYLIQNLALLLCCLLRLPACTLVRERRFFLRLTLFMLAYGVSETVGDLLYLHGWQVGSMADLTWTLPFAFFIVLALNDALHADETDSKVSRVAIAARSMQGLSVAAMAFLSIGVAALLATQRSLLGGCFLVAAFSLFAWRTSARERAWHRAHALLEGTVLQDALTGLGNRILLRNELSHRLQHSPAPVILLFADLDRFKDINDSLGHALGDQLLIEIGRRLGQAALPGSVVCRLGGDEFVVLSAADDAERAEQAGERILEAIRRPFHLDTHELRCSASVGVVLAEPGEQPDDLLRTADHAMYRAKELGKDRVQFFDAELRAQLSSRWNMEAELRACVEAGAMQVAFQPIYSMEQAGICGFEALARWFHPVLGNVPPVQFITLAEESGLILPLGAQVLEKACAQMASWNRSWGTSLSVSVNVSPRQFADAALMSSLLAILDRTGLPPSLLRLEITETALLTQESIVRQTLLQARAHGIRISLDDFGTGYSSLSFLLSLPVDEVKVDRSFVSHMHQDPDREELVRTVIHLGHSLGKRVVAEGVETEEDLLGLARMGCECVQGYLISKPLLPEAMEEDFASIAARGWISGATEAIRDSRNLDAQAHDEALITLQCG